VRSAHLALLHVVLLALAGPGDSQETLRCRL